MAGTEIPFAVQIIIIAVLLLLSALFSGLTLGLLGLDKTGLEIVSSSKQDNPIASRNAELIIPIREDGNLLLCTLLLGNVAVNALLSILMADLTDGTLGFLTSTAVIVVFGEITPQALCSRHALAIGSKAVPLVRVIIFLFYPVAKPLAFVLDKLLGRELGTIYTKHEMEQLVGIHMDRFGFDQETGKAMTGALKYQDMAVSEQMTPIEQVFMLSVDEKLSFSTIANIFKSGYSRIPVYEISRDNVIGLLFVKDLIFVDPDDDTPIRNFVQIFGRGVHVVWPDDKLGVVLRELKQGRSHMALVRDVNNEDPNADPYYELKGIITLEDIIEVILQDEIVDETDVFIAGDNIQLDRTSFDWARLRLLDSKITDKMLSPDEVKAVCAHLRTNHATSVSALSDVQLKTFIASQKVHDFKEAEQEVNEELPSDLMYKKGEMTNFCTLILSGKVTVLAGVDGFRSDAGAWTVLGSQALTSDIYTPDFSAYVADGPCRCLRLSREAFDVAKKLNASKERKIMSSNATESRPQRRQPPGRELSSLMSVSSENGSLAKENSRGCLLLAEIEKLESTVTSRQKESVQLDETIYEDTDIEEGVVPIIDATRQGFNEMNELQRALSNDGALQPRPKKKGKVKFETKSDTEEVAAHTGKIQYISPPNSKDAYT